MKEHTPQGQPTLELMWSDERIKDHAARIRGATGFDWMNAYWLASRDMRDNYEVNLAATHAKLAEARQENERLKARITELEGAIKWEPVEWEKPLNSHGDYIHSGTLFIRCTTFGEGIVHGYTFQEGECLMRRVTAATNEQPRP